MTQEDRYWAKVDRRGPDECWPWTACRNPLGYGTFRGGNEQLAHRYGFRLANGGIPPGLTICHRCDNPCCQNPSHLFAGTHRDNMQDMASKGRAGITHQVGEANGMARLSEEQVAEIRQQYATGATQDRLAAEFGVAQSQVGRIVRAQRWPGAEPIDGSKRRATRSSGHPHAKLSAEQAVEIVTRYAAGGVSQQALGDEYGVSQAVVSKLVLRGK